MDLFDRVHARLHEDVGAAHGQSVANGVAGTFPCALV